MTNNNIPNSTKLKINPNKQFIKTPKDVWSLTNEAAQAASHNTKNKGRELINLGQGFFSYSPPAFAIEAAKNSFDTPLNNQYSPTKGRPNLINALVKQYANYYSKVVDNFGPSNVQVCTGANEAILSCFVGLINPGDEVIVLEPFFDQYISNIQIPGGVVRYVPINAPENLCSQVTEGKDWKVDIEKLKSTINEKTKILVLNTPHNPIGKVFTREELLEIGQICLANNIIIVSDEVYEHLYFTEEPFPRIATLSPELANITLSVGSAGKSFAATGWRIGWIVSANADLLKYASMAHTRICFSSPSPLQEACASSIEYALANDYYKKMREEYKHKFDILCSVFDELNLPYTKPEGTYFVLVDFSKVKIPFETYEFPQDIQNKAKDFKISYWLINELGVVAIPPTEFYIPEHESQAETLLRFAVCKTDDYLEKAVDRLRLLKNYL
ncbi:kynurenine--oxoglutarate transaminase SCDLUD_003561 [Saccharomycodes ludwigii]|nr:hypothetical protein SCDLUD_003561 [Saccharomycodes ludwigii]KAH3900570.1 hypothetical protein SCDLUD_003561 [Saccharomycodes ludwigii]